MSDDEESGEWRFSLDEVGPDDETAIGQTDDTAGHDHGGSASFSSEEVPDALVEEQDSSNVAGSLTSVGPIEPETPSLEHAAFVVLGVYIGLLAIAGTFVPGFALTPSNVLLLTGGVLAVALVSFGFFGLLTPET